MSDSSWLPWLAAVAAAPFLPLFLVEKQKRREQLGEHERVLLQNGQNAIQLAQSQQEVTRLQHEQETLLQEIGSLKAEKEELQREYEGRPTKTERRYGIATVGVSGCGKTALTLRWANPRIQPEQVKATMFSKYDRTISRVFDSDSRIHVDHVFEVYDWGGEHIEEALTALVKLGVIHALLVIVDLGPFVREEQRHVFSQEHIDRQLQEFDQHVLRFFFAPAVVQHCKHYVLFINKSDLLSGFPAEVEKQARKYYERLINDMAAYSEQRGANLQVMVGSADTGAGTNRLYQYLIENILPEEARDEQLLQELQQHTVQEAAHHAVSATNVRRPGGPLPETLRVRAS